MKSIKATGLVTQGVLKTREGNFPIENNVWILGDDKDALVIDAAHDAEAIVAAAGERNILGLLLTHGHQDHINAALEVADALDTEIYLHPADRFLWDELYERSPDHELSHGMEFEIAGLTLKTLHTPGHTPGSVCFALDSQNLIFSGDTLFHGGPGATRWEYSDFAQILNSIESEIFAYAPETAVLPGHGQETSVAAEKSNIEGYRARGW